MAANWVAYEVEKHAWINANPQATPQEYEAAIKALLERFGL